MPPTRWACHQATTVRPDRIACHTRRVDLRLVRDDRSDLGRRGESIAAVFLADRGVEVFDRNVLVDGGELDLLARSGTRRLVVEVRSVRGSLRVGDRLPTTKLRRVSALARELGIHRVDFVGVAFDPRGVEVRWLRDVSAD